MQQSHHDIYVLHAVNKQADSLPAAKWSATQQWTRFPRQSKWQMPTDADATCPSRSYRSQISLAVLSGYRSRTPRLSKMGLWLHLLQWSASQPNETLEWIKMLLHAVINTPTRLSNVNTTTCERDIANSPHAALSKHLSLFLSSACCLSIRVSRPAQKRQLVAWWKQNVNVTSTGNIFLSCGIIYSGMGSPTLS